VLLLLLLLLLLSSSSQSSFACDCDYELPPNELDTACDQQQKQQQQHSQSSESSPPTGAGVTPADHCSVAQSRTEQTFATVNIATKPSTLHRKARASVCLTPQHNARKEANTAHAKRHHKPIIIDAVN
jgi:hypothetical protein